MNRDGWKKNLLVRERYMWCVRVAEREKDHLEELQAGRKKEMLKMKGKIGIIAQKFDLVILVYPRKR